MSCHDCHKEAKHYSPLHLCDFHYAERFSTQFMPELCKELGIEGKDIHFKKLFKHNMEQRGLWKKDGESLGSRHKRLSEAGTASRHLSSLGLALPE